MVETVLTTLKINYLTVLSQNIFSIKVNFDSLLTLVQRINILSDIIVLSEYWLFCNLVILVLNGYKPYCTTNAHNQKDGVVLYVHKRLSKIIVVEANISE